MLWYNEPDSWKIRENQLILQVTPKSDYWRTTHYGFVADSGPFLYCSMAGDFEASVKITGFYTWQYDQMGLMLRNDEFHWIKTGIEYVDGVCNFSAVVTNECSSWNVIPLEGKPHSLWIRVVRKKDAAEISFSTDGTDFRMSNIAWLPESRETMVGMMAASPDGQGFKAIFEEFSVKSLTDQ